MNDQMIPKEIAHLVLGFIYNSKIDVIFEDIDISNAISLSILMEKDERLWEMYPYFYFWNENMYGVSSEIVNKIIRSRFESDEVYDSSLWKLGYELSKKYAILKNEEIRSLITRYYNPLKLHWYLGYHDKAIKKLGKIIPNVESIFRFYIAEIFFDEEQYAKNMEIYLVDDGEIIENGIYIKKFLYEYPKGWVVNVKVGSRIKFWNLKNVVPPFGLSRKEIYDVTERQKWELRNVGR